MTTQSLDVAKKEAFGGRMLDLWNNAFLSLMISVGHQTALFDTLSRLPPSRSAAIAQAASLDERYVREWLAALVTGQIIDYDPQGDTYVLPPEHAAWLTRAAGLDNMAQFTQYVTMCGAVEPQIVECFRRGGGVPYAAYPRFQQLHREETEPLFDALLLGDILPLVPGLVARLQGGIDVLDLGCGAGHAINLMARAFPASRFVGYDLSEEGIAAGRAEALDLALRNAHFAVQDGATLDEPGRYDLVTAFNAIHDQAQPRTVLRAVRTALRPGGTFLMQDIAASSRLQENLDHPLAPTLYTASTFLCMTTSLAYGGEGLGTMWGEQQARALLVEAGFTGIETKQLPRDAFNTYYICSSA